MSRPVPAGGQAGLAKRSAAFDLRGEVVCRLRTDGMRNDGRPVESSSHAETAAVLEDIRTSEEQIARGEGVEHDFAEQHMLARLAEALSAQADSVQS